MVNDNDFKHSASKDLYMTDSALRLRVVASTPISEELIDRAVRAEPRTIPVMNETDRPDATICCAPSVE